MINEVLDQLTYLKLKSAYSYLRELHVDDKISKNELLALSKIRSLTPHFIDKYNIPLFFKGFFVNKFSISCSVK